MLFLPFIEVTPTSQHDELSDSPYSVCGEFELATFSGPRRLMMPGPSKFGASGEIRTPGLLVRSRRDDLIGSYFSTT